MADRSADAFLARLEVCVDRLEAVGADHETRLRALEQHKWRTAGAIALALVLVPIVLHFAG